VAYPLAAKGMIERRDRMMSFIDVLKRELVHAKAALDRASPLLQDKPTSALDV
jgi:hypothetical protein